MKNNIELVKSASEQIMSIAQNGKRNLIFGAGWMGTKLYEAFVSLDIPVDGFVVTTISNGNQQYQELVLYEKSSLNEKFMYDNLFVALRDRDCELIEELEKCFLNVIEVSYPQGLASIASKFYINYLENSVDLNQKTIFLNGMEMVNPFKKNYDYILSWIYEVGDLLLPSLFNDYRLVDEGPYEFGAVVLKLGGTVLDCGANIGLFSMYAASRDCNVYAFEPLQEAMEYLKEAELLYPKNIEIVPYALSEKTGEAEFYVQNNDLLGASMLTGNNSIDKKYKVKVTTIDSFVKENSILKVDFIKADIEGAERNMLIGAAETIKRDKPYLSICTYHLEDDIEMLEKIIHNIEPKYVIKHKWKKLFAYVVE